MSPPMSRPLFPVVWLSLAACAADGDLPAAADAAGPQPDASPPVSDATTSADATTAPDAAPAALPGFGAISGDCRALDAAALDAESPLLFENAIDFAATPFDERRHRALLTEGGQEILDDGNAGGSSLLSEVFAFEVLHRCEAAALLKTETEVVYQVAEPGAITDLLVSVGGTKLGVSVTRAVAFPFDAPYTVDQARALLEDKLADILESSALVAPEDAWEKHILHVVAYAPEHAAAVAEAHAALDPAVTADTIVIATVTDGDDAFIY
jgi:hypothetical protein